MLKVSRSCVVRGERGVIFLFSAKRPPRKRELSSYLRRAGQRRCFQRICLAAFGRGRPSLRSGSRSLQKNHSPVRPKLWPILLPRTRCSRNKNIDYRSLPLWGRWQPKGLTDEVEDNFQGLFLLVKKDKIDFCENLRYNVRCR